MSHIVNGACPLDCPDTCAWQIEVEDGKAIRMRGRKDHPYTRGSLCGKVNRYLDAVYAPDRLTTPLRRVGEKGEGRFQAIDWDEAIGLTATALQTTIDRYGPEAVLPFYYAGTLGAVQGWSLGQRLFKHLGATRLDTTICDAAAYAAQRVTMHRPVGTDPEDFAHAKLILVWGANLLSSNMHQWHFIHAAQQKGAHVVAIDPLPTDTAERCDQHLQLLPGTDAALAMGLMGELCAAGACDEEWLAECAVGWPELRERLADWNAERAAEICGLPASEIRGLAERIVTTRPTAIRLGLGLQRHGGAGAAIRAITVLGAVSGDFRHVGGGVVSETSGRFDDVTSGLEEPVGLPLPLARTINMSRLAEALTDTALTPAVHAMVVWNTNPAATVPDQSRVQQGFRRDDLHLTVLEHRLTDTALFADVVLPATMQTEHLDIHPSYGHHYLTLNLPAIEPVGQCLPNNEIFRRLATALELTHPRLHDSDEALVRQFIDTDRARERGITFESLCETGYAAIDDLAGTAPHANGGFPTRDGKLHITVPALAEDNLDPIPGYTPSHEGADPVLAQRFPLILITPAHRFFLNSTFADLPGHLRMTGAPTLFLSQNDATARGLEAGDEVEVANDRGSFRCHAAIHPQARDGVAWSYKAYWAKDNGGNNVNATTPVRDADMGGAPTFHDNRVEATLVAKANESTPSAVAAVGD